MPYRLERYNFNPHKCLGNFEYNEYNKPIFYKNQAGDYTDKNFRIVNRSGFLKDDRGNIIDNDGQVRVYRKMLLEPKDDMPMLYNYEGDAYRIQSIIGQFEKDDHSKEINFKWKKSGSARAGGGHQAADMLDRDVNAKGYLIDDKGNIVDDRGRIVFKYWQLMFQEPPKIFECTLWNTNWIRGRVRRDVTLNKRHDDVEDMDGRPINTMGYCIDDEENVVDREGGLVFKRVLLAERYGQDSEIPMIFRTPGRLNKPSKKSKN